MLTYLESNIVGYFEVTAILILWIFLKTVTLSTVTLSIVRVNNLLTMVKKLLESN